MAPLLLILVVLLREHLATNHLRMPRLPWVEKGLVAWHSTSRPQRLPYAVAQKLRSKRGKSKSPFDVPGVKNSA